MPKGHRLLVGIDVGVVRRDLMQLLCIYLAKGALLADKSYGSPFQQLIEDFGSSESTRLLLHAAVVLRTIDDQAPKQSEIKTLAQTEDASLGSLEETVQSGHTKYLSLREACNKLIHAREVTFQPNFVQSVRLIDGHVMETEKRTCPRRIILTGDYRGDEWYAVLDVIEFIKQGTKLILAYDSERRRREEEEDEEKKKYKAIMEAFLSAVDGQQTKVDGQQTNKKWWEK